METVKSSKDLQQSSLFQRAALLGGGGTVFLAILGILGWTFRLPILTTLHSNYIPIAASTCILLLAQGAILLLYVRYPSLARRWPFTSLAAVSSMFGVLALAGPLFNSGGLDFEGLLFSSNALLGSIPVNRMSPLTGVLLCASGIALLLLLLYEKKMRAMYFAESLAGFTVMAGLVATLSYLYGSPLLYGSTIIPMAIPTSLALLFLGGGLVAALGTEGFLSKSFMGESVRAMLLRTFVPLAFVAVLVSDILQHLVSKENNAFVSALAAVLFGTIAASVVARAGRTIGNTIVRAEAERNRSQQALLESTQRFQTIFDNAKDGILLADVETWKFQMGNPAICEMLGYSCDELYRMGIDDIYPERDLPQIREWVNRRARGEKIGLSRNLPVKRKNGTVFYADVNALPIVMDGKQYILGLFRDITERKQAEEALRLSVRLLQTVHEHMEITPLLWDFVSTIKEYTGCDAVGIRVLDEQGNIPYQAYEGFSEEFYDSENPLSIKSDFCMCINVITGDFDPDLPFYTRGGSFYSNGTSRFLLTVSEEEKGQTRNRCNREGYESVALVPIRKANRTFGLIHVADGREDMLPLHVVEKLEEAAMQLGTAFERFQAEERLRESEERFRSVFEGLPVGMAIADLDGRVLRANSIFCGMLGYSEDELPGRSIFDLTHPDERDTTGKTIAELISGKTTAVRMEKRCVRKDGDLIWVSAHASVIRDHTGKPLFLSLQALDITEHRLAQDKIEHLNRVLRAIRDVNQLIVQERDRQRLIEKSCQILVETRGCLGALVILSDPAGTPRIHAQAGFGEGFERVAEELTQGILPPCCNEARLGDRLYAVIDRSTLCPSCRPDGEHSPGDALCLRLQHEGKLYGYMAVSVPPGYGHEEEELSLFIEMAGDVSFALHNMELEEAARRAEAQLLEAQKMEALGTLAGGIAHDFNNILGIIIGYTEMAQWDIAEGRNVEGELGEILKSANRAKELVKQILAFSRHGKQEKKPVQIRLIVKEALNMLRATLPSTIAIEKEIESRAAILADPNQVHQVLMNLCTNAAHAMMDKGGAIAVTLADVLLGPEAIDAHPDLEPGAHVKLTVKDTGHGIDPAIMDRIFNPFFTTKEPGVGTGLGLSVVHGIVKSHGGSITVESTPGKGTAFHVLFPILGDTAAVETLDVSPLPTGRERIFVVDDEPILAQVMKEMLEHLGYQVDFRTSSFEALQALSHMPAENLCDLVITDMTMPGLTGADLVSELHKYRPKIPVILCTGFSEQIDAGKAKNLGLAGFLMKPIVLRELARLIREVLDRGVQ